MNDTFVTRAGCFDPVEHGMTVEGIRAICDESVESAKQMLVDIKNVHELFPKGIEYSDLMGRFDDLVQELHIAGSFAELMSEVHPDPDVRDAATDCRPTISAFTTSLYMDAGFAQVVRDYASAVVLSGTKKRLLQDVLRDLRRNGLDLSPDDQKRYMDLDERITVLEQEFSKNITEDVGTMRVEPARLKGCPDSFIQQHKPEADGLVTLTTDYPDYFPVCTHAEDRELVYALTFMFNNRGAPENVVLLEEILKLREESAFLLGYKDWASYVLEDHMARTPENVAAFIQELRTNIQGKLEVECAEIEREHTALGLKKIDGRVPACDLAYVSQLLRMRKFNYDSKLMSEYLEVGSVVNGLLAVVEKLYDLEIYDVPVSEATRWHEDVRVLDICEKDEQIARVYLDLYPREGKYKHAAMFNIRGGKALPDGSYALPMAAVVCNFPKSTDDAPALMTHDDVTTLFHEFGHALHHVLTKQPLVSYSGTNTAIDFVEVPSQMFEEWTFQREVLDMFARHHKTGELVPDELFAALQASRTFGEVLNVERQILLMTLDSAFHTLKQPVSTDDVLRDVTESVSHFAFLPGTHFQASFGHLMGYDASYYSYQWSLALACDVLTRFKNEGFMSVSVASDWRKMVLEQGAGEDENELITQFLGRPTNTDAYVRYLTGESV